MFGSLLARRFSKFHPSHFPTTWARYHSSSEVKWLWKVDERIKGLNEANKHGTRSFGFILTFNSKLPLEPINFRQAQEDLLRKCPNMRTVVRDRGGDTWYCQLPNTELNFKMMDSEENFEESCFDLMGQGFADRESLPFKVRVIERGIDVPCKVEGVRDKYPHQYDLFLIVNHALADGNDITHFALCLFQSLNSQLAGEPLGDDIAVVFEKNKDLQLLLEQRRKLLLQDPSRIESIKSDLPKFTEIPSIFQVFPRPEISKVTTKHLQRKFNSRIISTLLSKCARNGVTFNSLCIAVSNITLVELMKKAGLIKDSFNIRCLVFVNLRRHIQSGKHILGLYTLPFTFTSNVPGDVNRIFWDYCKHVNQELRLTYSEDAIKVLDQSIVQEIIDSEYSPHNYTINPRPVCHSYSNVNNGDITEALPCIGECVQITDVKLYQQNHNYKHAFMQTILTFRGEAQCNFCYASDYFSDDTANLIADKFMEIIYSVAE